ncbi:hypothetical protein FOCC_FOCC006487 [Frankliniella occidentalis]|nr:hypothetical protein FOCC_FOCC006487 [Frankliniella occidentalis]
MTHHVAPPRPAPRPCPPKKLGRDSLSSMRSLSRDLGRDSLGSLGRDSLGSLGRDSLGSLGRDSLGSLGRDSRASLGRESLGSLGRDSLGSLGRDSLGSLGSLGRDSLGSLGRESRPGRPSPVGAPGGACPGPPGGVPSPGCYKYRPPAHGGHSSPAFPSPGFPRLVTGRASPCVDQGYHTLGHSLGHSLGHGLGHGLGWCSPGPWRPGPHEHGGAWPELPWPHPTPAQRSCTATPHGDADDDGDLDAGRTHTFDSLPDDLVLQVFSWLDCPTLCRAARVCRRWSSLAWEPTLWRCVRLRGPSLSGDRAVRGVLRRLGGCGATIQRLQVTDGATLSDRGLTQLARRCPGLQHLQLHGCQQLGDAALAEIATRCTNLQRLDLTGCTGVTTLAVTPGPEPPRRLQLQYLDLTDCEALEDAGLRVVVRNCPQLVYLYLRRCINITGKYIARKQSKLQLHIEQAHSLTQWRLSGANSTVFAKLLAFCVRFSDAGVKYVPSFCSQLRELSVSDCGQVTDFGLYELAKLGATLRYLSVAKCDQVSDAGLKVLSRRCYKLSDDAITVLARSCPRLRALDIGKCDVSDAGLRALAESCPNLKKLSVRACDLVTDRGVQCIAYYCRGLQQLNIQDCQISLEGYRAVKKYCKRCIIEHTNPGFF